MTPRKKLYALPISVSQDGSTQRPQRYLRRLGLASLARGRPVVAPLRCSLVRSLRSLRALCVLCASALCCLHTVGRNDASVEDGGRLVHAGGELVQGSTHRFGG